MPCVRRVKTKTGATAVQVVDSPGRGSRTLSTSGPVVRGFDENGEMAFELPVVDAASLAAWCEAHLGSPAESELFRAGHLTCVIGTRLADGREVVVRVRAAAPRLTACTEVQRRLSDSGYPYPQQLASPAPLGEHAASARATSRAGPRCPARAAPPSPLPQRSPSWCTWLPGPGRCPRWRPRAVGRMEPQPGRVVALARGPGRGPEPGGWAGLDRCGGPGRPAEAAAKIRTRP